MWLKLLALYPAISDSNIPFRLYMFIAKFYVTEKPTYQIGYLAFEYTSYRIDRNGFYN